MGKADACRGPSKGDRQHRVGDFGVNRVQDGPVSTVIERRKRSGRSTWKVDSIILGHDLEGQAALARLRKKNPSFEFRVRVHTETARFSGEGAEAITSCL